MPKTEKPKAAKAKSKTKAKPKKKPSKINKRNRGFFKFIDLDGNNCSLTIKQKLFTEKYFELRHATKAAIEAGYSEKTAYKIGSENLIKPQIRAYLAYLLDLNGFNDRSVYREHLYLINQDKDLTNKKGAIDMFYKLKGNYAPEETKVKHELTEELLDRIIKG